MEHDTIRIRRALISVSDKTGLPELARRLRDREVEILSSGGTARFLQQEGISVLELSDFTRAPEMLDGRVKTLHPKVAGGILAVRSNAKHMKQLDAQGFVPIDLVIVNLYPFEKTYGSENASEAEIIEQIDIGGPTLLRAAAKNSAFVTTLVEPEQYEAFLHEFKEHDGNTSLAFRRNAARRVFERTAAYDSTIAGFFQKDVSQLPTHYSIALERKWDLRYGENPHQDAGFYVPARALGSTVLDRVLQGKALSYNNLMDVHAALDLMADFPQGQVAAIFKHTNPCGVGTSSTSLRKAYERALSCDPVSAFGGIVAFSHPVDGELAQLCNKTFTEIILAPSFSDDARSVFKKKKNLRLLEVDLAASRNILAGYDIRRAVDGYLLQNRDRSFENLSEARVVTKRAPTSEEMAALALGWTVAKHVKSNAIILTNREQTLGIGAGQMSRVDSSRFAALKADPKKLQNVALASDAFFPFRDGIDEAARHGVKSVVQPGGSIRDEEVIQATDEHDMAMLFTGIRHFKH